MNGFQIGILKRESLPKTLRFLSFHSAWTCSTITLAWTFSLRDAMPSDHPNLTLDEQSFQGLLSAAFTIQEYNDRVRQAPQTQAEPEAHLEPEAPSVCPHCGAPKPAEGSRCLRCDRDEFRPGERLQRNWASMWLMSQEQSLWPEPSPPLGEAAQKLGEAAQEARAGARQTVPPLGSERSPRAQEETGAIHYRALGTAGLGKSALGDLTPDDLAPNDLTLNDLALDSSVLDQAAPETKWTTAATADLTREDFPQEDSAPEDSDLTVQPLSLSARDDSSTTDDTTDETTGASASSLTQRLAEFRAKLSFHRADLYLGTAVFVAALALLWPAASAPRRATLGLWERTLVNLGVAEAPAPLIHFQGDPGIQVWVDPHTALYYCPGEEQYGKTADGRITSQREAQMDRFEPAGRSACE